MSDDCSQGAFSRLTIGGQQMRFKEIDPLDSAYHLTDDSENTITGHLDRFENEADIGLEVHHYRIRLQPSFEELTVLWPLIGLSSDNGTFVSADDLPDFTMIMDKVADIFTYANCKVDKAIFVGQTGRVPVQLILEVYAKTEAASAFSGTAQKTDGPIAFHRGVLTLQAAARPFDRFQLAIDYNLEVTYDNSTTATCLAPRGRAITLGASTPYIASTKTLYDTPGPSGPSATGAAATLAWTKSGQSTSIAMANVKAVARPPSIPKSEIRLPLYYNIYATDEDDAVEVTHVDGTES